MASNWIPETAITVGTEDSDIITLTKPVIYPITIWPVTDEWLSNYDKRCYIHFSFVPSTMSKAIKILGFNGSYHDVTTGDNVRQEYFTQTFTLTDKTVDYVQLKLRVKEFNYSYWVNPVAWLAQKDSNRFDTSWTCYYEKLYVNVRFVPDIAIDTVQYEDAGNQRTYTVSGRVHFFPSMQTYGDSLTTLPNFQQNDTYMSEEQIVEFRLQTSAYTTRDFISLIPNSQLALQTAPKISRSYDQPIPVQVTKPFSLRSMLNKLFKSK